MLTTQTTIAISLGLTQSICTSIQRRHLRARSGDSKASPALIYPLLKRSTVKSVVGRPSLLSMPTVSQTPINTATLDTQKTQVLIIGNTQQVNTRRSSMANQPIALDGTVLHLDRIMMQL
jgi:hypothetical protein